MKKKLIKLFILILLIIPIKSYAAGSITVSTGSLSLNVGTTGSFSVIANNAAGRVDISSSNPSVCTIGTSSIWVENNSTPISVNAINAGNCVITVALVDASTFDEEELHNTYSISVNVTTPPPPVIPSNNNNNTNNNTNNYNNNNNYTNPVTDMRSGNNNLKSITVDNYNLEKIDDVNYTLTVKNKTDKISIKATPEDTKATVTGTGNVNLNVGENIFEIKVTAENTAVKTYYLKVTRKSDNYKLSELEEALEDLDKVVVTMSDENYTLTTKMIKKIKDTNKDVTINKLDENNQIIYSWRIKANNIKDTSTDLSLKLNDNFEKKDEFDKLTGFRKGIYISLSELGSKFPKDTIIKYNVKDILQGKDKIYLYAYDYNNNTIQLLKDDLEISNGYINITLDKEKNYFITKALITGENVSNNIKSNNNLYFVASSVEFFVIAGLLLYIIKKKTKKKKDISLN